MPPSPRALRASGPAVCLALLALLGCGGSDADEVDMRVDEDAVMDTTPAGTPAPPTLPSIGADLQRQAVVTLDDSSLVLDRELLPAGEVTFQATNAGGVPHALAIAGGRVDERSEPIEPGQTSSLTVRLDAGTYRLFCPDTTSGAAHAEQGMSAPIIIR